MIGASTPSPTCLLEVVSSAWFKSRIWSRSTLAESEVSTAALTISLGAVFEWRLSNSDKLRDAPVPELLLLK